MRCFSSVIIYVVVLFHELYSITKVVKIVLLVRGCGITELFDEVLHDRPTTPFINPTYDQPLDFVGWCFIVLYYN